MVARESNEKQAGLVDRLLKLRLAEEDLIFVFLFAQRKLAARLHGRLASHLIRELPPPSIFKSDGLLALLKNRNRLCAF